MARNTAAQSSDEIIQYLATYKPRIDQVLSRVLQTQVGAAQKLDPVYGQLLAEIKTLLERGGKRLRPVLTLLAYQGFGGANDKAILQAAASQELFHAFILMHDDIIDRDGIRWGGPNITSRYFEKFSEKLETRDAMHFAESWALLAGDVCLGLSQQTLLESGFAPELILKASSLQQQALFEVIGGESLDIAMSLEDLELAEERLLTICRYKTAAYSFRMPLQTGAVLAGASTGRLQNIEQFAFELGTAFQLQDDLLGMFGDEQKLGKSTLTDLREGKRTLLILYGLRRATKAGQKILADCLGNPNVTSEDLTAARKILTISGAKTQVERRMHAHLQKALKTLPDSGFNQATVELLTQLANSLATRQV
jgi:geranylgeranyl pyrophosphate synthase